MNMDDIRKAQPEPKHLLDARQLRQQIKQYKAREHDLLDEIGGLQETVKTLWPEEEQEDLARY